MWIAEARDGDVEFTSGLDRDEVTALLLADPARDPELMVGLDFAFGLPDWFARARGATSGREVWELVARERGVAARPAAAVLAST